MAIRYVLFDLDGTLLPMDQNVFLKRYFKGLAQKLVPLRFEPTKLFESIWKGTGAMIANDGSRVNEECFWEVFRGIYGEELVDRALPLFDEFYAQDFDSVSEVCGFTPRAKETVDTLKEKGYTVALATNPVFPAVATRLRIKWAGLRPEDFAHYTTFENSHYCKPSADYYREVAEKIGAHPEECLMVGNDISDDMPAATAGMKVFLLTDCLIAREGEQVSDYPNGSFDELMAYIRSMEA